MSSALSGKRVLVSAGPTYEDIDPVRFIGNRSSGKMGFALAAAAVGRGAHVVLVAGPTALPTPGTVERIDVRSAAQMREAVLGVGSAVGPATRTTCAPLPAAAAARAKPILPLLRLPMNRTGSMSS